MESRHKGGVVSNKWRGLRHFAVLIMLFGVVHAVKATEHALAVFDLEDRRQIEQAFKGALRYHPIHPETIEEPEALLGLDEPAFVYRVIVESGPDRLETHRYIRKRETPDSERIEYRLNDEESQWFAASEGNDVVITGATDRKEGVRTEFNPAKPLIPRGLEPGGQRRTSSRVRIMGFDKPGRLRHEGEVDITLTHLGNFHVQIGFGEFDAYLLKLEAQGKIGPAKIMHRQYYFYAEDTGLVAFVETRKISAFAIYEKNERQAMVLEREESF
jgi:hypothetical protein